MPHAWIKAVTVQNSISSLCAHPIWELEYKCRSVARVQLKEINCVIITSVSFAELLCQCDPNYSLSVMLNLLKSPYTTFDVVYTPHNSNSTCSTHMAALLPFWILTFTFFFISFFFYSSYAIFWFVIHFNRYFIIVLTTVYQHISLTIF